jgi:hypothetical protein
LHCLLSISAAVSKANPAHIKRQFRLDAHRPSVNSELRENLAISALNRKDTGKFLWRPDYRARLNEWVADFALVGKAALDGPDWASRMVLFRLYYLGLAPYETARHFLGLSETNWVNWTEQIRHRCGKELLSRGMFPPRKYFASSE